MSSELEPRINDLENRMKNLEEKINFLLDRTYATDKTTNITNIECGAQNVIPYVEKMVQQLESLSPLLIGLEAESTILKDFSDELSNLMKHIHDSHFHPVAHSVDNLNTDEKGSYMLKPFSSDITNKLIEEVNTEHDKDQNGMILNIDFIFDHNDDNIPAFLKNISSSDNPFVVTLTWDEYIESLPEGSL